MAFTTPITWTTNQLVTAANLNEQIRDNMNAAWFQPAVHAFHSAAQSIASGALTALAFDSERFDQAFGVASTQHDTVINNPRLTCRVAGVYQISGIAEWASSPASASGVLYQIRLNGLTVIGKVTTGNIDVRTMNVTTLYSLAVSDYVELMVQQTSGAAININAAGNYSPAFMMARVG